MLARFVLYINKGINMNEAKLEALRLAIQVLGDSTSSHEIVLTVADKFYEFLTK